MSVRNIEKIKKLISHPLEEHFDIEHGSTEITKTVVKTDIAVCADYDNKDAEIDKDFQEIMDKALGAYDHLDSMLDGLEARHIALLSSSAAGMLSLALSAAEKKHKLKAGKDRLRKTSGPTTVNNTLTINRNDLLREIQAGAEFIEGVFTEGTDS